MYYSVRAYVEILLQPWSLCFFRLVFLGDNTLRSPIPDTVRFRSTYGVDIRV